MASRSETGYDIGVEYKAPTTGQLDLHTLSPRELENTGIRFVRVQWTDLTNTTRFRILPTPYFLELLASKRGGINIAKVVLGLVNLSVADGFSSIGEYLYVPDVRTLRRCPFEEGHAAVMGRFEEKKPYEVPGGTMIGKSVEVPLCPRTVLERVVRKALTNHTQFLVGFESEFVLLSGTYPLEPVGTHAFSTAASLRSGWPASKVLHEIAKAVQDAGIELQLYHGEAAPGQYEVTTGPLPPLEAADALVHTREIIYNVASLHGLRATFMPKPTPTSAGSAAHAHISVHTTLASSPPKVPSTLSALESQFLSGLMTHLPALPALTLPTSASYNRVGDGVWSGGTYVCWGSENREAPIRLVNAHSPSSRRFEMRFIDGTANPYLALAGIIGAGLDGIERQSGLSVQDISGEKSAAQMSGAERKERGVVLRMPLSWEEGRERLLGDGVVRGVLGEEMVEKYLSVNKLLNGYLEGEQDMKRKMQRVAEFY